MAFISLHELYPTAIKYCATNSAQPIMTGKDQAMMFMVAGMLIGFVVMLVFGEV